MTNILWKLKFRLWYMSGLSWKIENDLVKFLHKKGIRKCRHNFTATGSWKNRYQHCGVCKKRLKNESIEDFEFNKKMHEKAVKEYAKKEVQI